MSYYSNVNRFTGLSGIDTESMIEKLMKAESQKLYRYQKKGTSISWKQEAYRNSANILKEFQNKFLNRTSSSSILLNSNFLSKTATATINGANTSDITLGSVTGAKAGKHTLEILQLAKGEKHVSAEGSVGGKIKGSKEFNFSDIKAGDSFNITLDGKIKSISFSKEDLEGIKSNEDFVKKLNEKLENSFGKDKVKASLENGKLSFEPSGLGHELKISEGSGRLSSFTGTKEMKDEDWAKLAGGKYKINVDGKEIEVDFSKFDSKDKKLTGKQAISIINSALEKEGVSVRASLNEKGAVSFRALGTDKEIKLGGDLFNKITGKQSVTLDRSNVLVGLGGISNGAANSLQKTDTLENIFGSDAFDKNGNMKFEINGKTITLKKGFTLDEMEKAINNSGAGVKLSYNSTAGNFTLESKSQGDSSKIRFGEGSDKFKAMLGFGAKGSKFEEAKDAKIKLNGIETTRSSNEFEIDGLKLTLNSITKSPITIEVKENKSDAKKLVQDFVKSYNEIVEKLNNLVGTNRPKGKDGKYFEPLTDEEKKSMSESEIKAWEEKAKTGLLYRDEILSKVTSEMRAKLNEPLTLPDGTKIKLSDLGITTSPNYRDQGKLVIDESKLDKAFEKYDMKDIAELFTKSSDISYADKSKRSERMASQGLGERLNDIINDAISSTGDIAKKAGIKGTISEGKNDLQDQLKEYNSKISKLKTYLTQKENYYYAMFAKMESAIMKSNNQMNYLQSMVVNGNN